MQNGNSVKLRTQNAHVVLRYANKANSSRYQNLTLQLKRVGSLFLTVFYCAKYIVFLYARLMYVISWFIFFSIVKLYSSLFIIVYHVVGE